MKFSLNIFIRTILLIALWLFCIYKICLDFDHKYWFDDLIHTVLIVLSVIISLVFVYVDFKQYKRQRTIFNLISPSLTFIFIAVLIITINHLNKQDKSPTIMYASKFYNGLNTISIDFRENSTYKCGNSSFMGDSYYSRGHYSIKDSIIYLDKSNLFGIIRTDKLLIKTVSNDTIPKKKNILSLILGSPSIDTLPNTFLYQLNVNGERINSAIVLEVSKNIMTTGQ